MKKYLLMVSVLFLALTSTAKAAAPYIVESVAKIRSTNLVGQTQISLQGYYGAGTPGGGILAYAPSEAGADNSCTIIVDSAGHRYVRVGGLKDVTQCGADPTGVADSATAIQAAINLAPISNNCTSVGSAYANAPGGSFKIGASLDTFGRCGVAVKGSGMAATVFFATGNFPVFKDIGTSVSGTAFVQISDMEIKCAGMANANGHGIQWSYAYNGKVSNVAFYACNRPFYGYNGAWQIELSHLRVQGTGALQNNYGLYFGEADPTNPIINMAFVITDVQVLGVATNCFRLINFQGTKASKMECGAAGSDQWYLCDPTTGTAPCQWGHFNTVLADSGPASASVSGFKIVKGNASEMGQMWLTDLWTGHFFGETGSNACSVYVDGATSLVIEASQITDVHCGAIIKNSTKTSLMARIEKYDGGLNGEPAVLVDGGSDNMITALAVPTSYNSTITGYNGYIEQNASLGNEVYGFGLGTCGISLLLNGSAAGITYAATTGPTDVNQCRFETAGRTAFVNFLMTLTNKGASVGIASLSGLPFTSTGSVFSFGAIGPCSGTANMAAIPGAITAQVVVNATTVNLATQAAAGTVNLTDANFTNTSTLICALKYTKR